MEVVEDDLRLGRWVETGPRYATDMSMATAFDLGAPLGRSRFQKGFSASARIRSAEPSLPGVVAWPPDRI